MNNKKTTSSAERKRRIDYREPREVDTLTKDVQSWWEKTFVFMKKTEVTTWQAFFVIAFFTGAMVTAILLVRYNGQTKSGAANTGTATLSWTANTESDLAGYKVYYGTTSRGSNTDPNDCITPAYCGYNAPVTLTVAAAGASPTYTFSNLVEGSTYYFSVTAYDTSNNESAFSSEVSKLIPAATPATCTSFTYSDWGTCQSDNTQTRTVATSTPSGCTGGTPVLSQSCTYVPPTCSDFTYSVWGACQSDNTQTRTVATSTPSGCTGGTPILSQSCTYTAPVCTSFTYSDWGTCQSGGFQTRTVATSTPSGCTDTSSVLSQSCTYVPPTCSDFTYSVWGECQSNNTQTRTVATSTPSGCTGGTKVLTQSCTYSAPACTSFTYSDWGDCQSNSTQTRTVTTKTPSGCTDTSSVLAQNCSYDSGDKDGGSSKKKTTTSSRSVKNSSTKVTRGTILTQSGKKFTKNSTVKLYFSKPGGGYYPPTTIKTDAKGNFSTSYRVNKPKGTYSWYAVDTKTGKKSKTAKYTVR